MDKFKQMAVEWAVVALERAEMLIQLARAALEGLAGAA